MDARDTIKNIKTDTGSLLLNPRFIGPCMAGLFCLIVATVLDIAYLFTMATVLLALPFAGYIIGIVILRSCTVNREPLVVATQGEIAEVVLKIECGLSRLPPGLTVRDKLPKWVEAKDNVGFEIFPERSVEIHSSFRVTRRGRYRIGPAKLFAVDPLGMLRLKHRAQGVTDLIVHPRPVPFNIGRLAGGRMEFECPNRSGRLAPRGDFAGVREYRFGDEFRRIHWKTTARTQRLSVMEFEDSTIGSVMIMLDLSNGSDYGDAPITSLDIAAGAAAFALRECLRQRRPARLSLPGETSVYDLDVHSPGSLSTALNVLSDAKADSSLSSIDLLRSCPGGYDAILISSRATKETSAAANEAAMRGISLIIALVDPEPFGRQSPDEVSVADLERAGAYVELIREIRQ